MLDRASTFAHPDIVKMLHADFVPVAIDQAYQRRQQDAEGAFYRKIAGQGPRNDFRGTTQGFYAASNSGELHFYNNNRDPDKVARLMREALDQDTSKKGKVKPIEVGKKDARYNPDLPEGGLVIRVHSKVLGGYPDSKRWTTQIFQEALGRDNLWITGAEHAALAKSEWPDSLGKRLARYHLVDNTRGEPPMWKRDEIRQLEWSLEDGVLTGKVNLSTEDGERRYVAALYGRVASKDGKVTRFDLVSKGLFEGGGRFTRNPPPGKFPFAVSFTLADGSDVADAIPPQGSRGWLDGYFR